MTVISIHTLVLGQVLTQLTIPIVICLEILAVCIFHAHTVYGKTFEGENFCGFRGFLANRESFPLESFAVYST